MQGLVSIREKVLERIVKFPNRAGSRMPISECLI